MVILICKERPTHSVYIWDLYCVFRKWERMSSSSSGWPTGRPSRTTASGYWRRTSLRMKSQQAIATSSAPFYKLQRSTLQSSSRPRIRQESRFQVPLEIAVYPAAGRNEVSSRTSEADYPTYWEPYDVTLADGLGQWRDWRILSSPPIRCRLEDQVPHATSTEENNDHPPTSRAQHVEGSFAQDLSTRQCPLRHLSNIWDYRTLPAHLCSMQSSNSLKTSAPRVHADKNLTTSRPSSQQLPAHTSSTTGSCHLSVICKQPFFSLEDYETSVFTVKKTLLN